MSSTESPDFVLPPSWQRYRVARRGSAGPVRFTPAATARATVDQRLTAMTGLLDKLLAARTTEESTRLAAREWLSGDPGARPFGAAVVGFVLNSYDSAWWHDSSLSNPVADVWITEHGLPFAAEAAVIMVALRIEDDYAPPYPRSTVDDKPGIRHRRLDETDSGWGTDSRIQALLRVRQALAAATEEEYAKVVDTLTPYREAHPYARTAAGVLVPEQRSWFEPDVRSAAVTGHDQYLANLLLTAAATEDDVRTLFPVATISAMVRSLPMFVTMLDGVGAAATPALFAWLDEVQSNADIRKRLLSALTLLPGDEVTQGLIDRIDTKYVRPALVEHAELFPARTLRLLAGAGGSGAVADLLRAHLLKHGDLAGQVLPLLGPEAAARVSAILADSTAVAPAPLSSVPAVLADPPWLRTAPPAKPVVITGLSCTDPATVRWLPEERERWAETEIRRFDRDGSGEPQARMNRILANKSSLQASAGFFLDGPEELIRPALARWQPTDGWHAGTFLRPIAARFELDLLPGMLVLARTAAAELAGPLQPFASPEVAVLMADWLARLKSVRDEATTWLLRHPAAASRALVPPALGKAGKSRRQAETALLTLHANGHTETVRAAARGYGDEAAAAIEILLAVDPLTVVPVKIPPVPAWAQPGLLPPVLLRDGSGRLPDSAVPHLITMLALSKTGDPYPGLATVREACEPVALAGFCRGVFDLWQASGAESKENWALEALGVFGDDETVRMLSPLILAWPGENGHNKAVTGLRILSAIGTDVALMHLHGIAQRSRFTGLKNAARQKMDEVAAAIGLTADQLADRLVPDFGLAADGTLVLDYGPRQFTVGFDEQLKPYVSDAAGKRLKSLPKPGVKDDPELAPAAAKRFGALKKDVRTVAADQVRRLEQAMVTGRRWSGADFQRLFVGHPLLWHIVRRLVWVRFDAAGQPGAAFRIAEDRTLSTMDDETTTLADDAVVGVAHPLHLGDTGPAWAEVFADYQILQPFAQLGRPVLTLTEAERAASTLDRFRGVKVPTGRLIGLERRGWRRETPQDAGVQSQIEFTVEPGRTVVVAIEPGIAVGYLEMFPEQEVTDVFLHDGTGSRWWNQEKVGHRLFGTLDPVVASEILRDLTAVTEG